MNGSFGSDLVASLLPEILLVVLAAACALLGVFMPRMWPGIHRWIAVAGLLGAVSSAAYTLHATSQGSGVVLSVWGGGLVVDRFSLYVTVLVSAFALITCLTSDVYLRQIPGRTGAFFALLLLTTAALSALAAESEMATMFLTLELVIVCITAMQALVKTDDRAVEAAWKLLVEGAVASALLLYGMAILYAVGGSTSLSVVGAAAARAPAAAGLGIALVLLGLTLPLGIAPLRAWVSRAGEAMPATVAGFAITAGVTAGAVAWLRFGVSGLGGGAGTWLGLTAALAALGVITAALLAVRHDSVSGLAGAVVSGQAALLLVAVISAGPGASSRPAQGTTAFLFALGVFGVSVLGTFAMLGILQAARLPDHVGNFRGLGRRSPAAALLLALALVGLIGAPPAAGFLARILLLESTVDAGYGWLAAVAVAAAAALAIPVIRLVASVYADRGEDAPFTMAASPLLTRIVAAGCCAAGVLATVLAQPLLLLAQGASGPIH